MINISVQTGVVPHQLKIAKVRPIFKAGNKEEFLNYRPVSVLPIVSKIYEKIVYKRLIDYLEWNSVLTEHQYGFRKNRSTTMALHVLIDKLHKAIENKYLTIGIFLDLSKAFDTVNHKILLQKLEYYGIRGNALLWFTNYLSNRQQYVFHDKINSKMKYIECGVPQGSILGPLLFLIYINDLINVSKSLYTVLFADDTNMFYSDKNPDKIMETINNELAKIDIWFKVNKLSLNTSKTHYILFGNIKKAKQNAYRDLNININGTCIQSTDKTKFLGVYIDQGLTWEAHINYTCNKISKITGVLLRARNKLYTDAMITLYNTLALPYFSYGITLWGMTY